MTVYRHLTQEQLDNEYNVRASIPDHLEIFDRWKRDSEAFRSDACFEADLKYGDDPAQSIDLFRTSCTNAPIVVFIHGGYWQSLDKSDFSYIARPYIEDGFNFAAVNYRLAPSVTMDDIVSDNRNALIWLSRNAGKFECDSNQIFVTGSSAGGHLTAKMISTDWERFSAPKNLVKGGCALSGLYDLEPIRLCYLNEKIRLDLDGARRNSPLFEIPSFAPTLLLSVGGDESDEFHRQQASFYDAWKAKGLSCRVIEQSDGHHFDMCDRLGDRGEPVYRAVVEMMRATIAARAESIQVS